MSSDQNKNEYDIPIVDHEYDGIQEFNNPAPFWWQLFFYLSIVFGVGYYFYYEVFDGPNSNRVIQQELAQVYQTQINSKKNNLPTEESLQALLVDTNQVKSGREQYLKQCASCHASDGGGQIGPNLTDAYWIHGKGSLLDLYKVIDQGVLDKGMPAWGSLLKNDELKQIVVYVKSLQGTKPQNAKSPQGDLIK